MLPALAPTRRLPADACKLELDLRPSRSVNRHLPTIPRSDSVEEGEIVENEILPSELPSTPQHPLKNQPEPPSSHPSTSHTWTPSSEASTATAASHTPSCAPANEPMTDEDLDHAKSLVLDLLGWGVTPEYLVDCGLSPGAIYRIFTDLRLRFPNNLVLREKPISTLPLFAAR